MSKPPTIKVIVCAEPAHGKTTAARLIQETLMAAGFGVHNADPDPWGTNELQAKRVAALVAKDTLVDIEIVHARRDGINMWMHFKSMEEYEKLLSALRMGENALRNVQSMTHDFDDAADVLEQHVISMDAGRDPSESHH